MNDLFKSDKVTCYACKNGLTGKEKICYACEHNLLGRKNFKTGEEWYCECSVWECQCRKCDFFYCPLCNEYLPELKGLEENVKSKISIKAYWIANMVTHYRHNHIKSWNKMWDRTTGNYYRNSFHYEDEQYERRKEEVNERAKRQIIKKAKSFLQFHQVTSIEFLELKGYDEKTVALAKRNLDNK